MFSQLEDRQKKRWNRSRLLSLGLHCAVLFALLYRAAPVLITPSDVALGIPGSSGSVTITYLAPVGQETTAFKPEQPRLVLKATLSKKKPEPAKPRPEHQPLNNATVSDAPQQTARGGSPFGRVPGSPLVGDEVVPALPEVFPDPPVSRADLPSGVEGDVIVEVTIDSQGNVVETKLIQGIGYGIEQKVLAVLQRWRFRPAMRDGVTIASQHIVHFHYPS